MTTETEVKIKVEKEALPGIRERLGGLGFQQTAQRAREENLLWDDSKGRLEGSGSALRLRKYGQKQILTFKGPRVEHSHLKIREEIETEIGDFHSMTRVLEAIGMVVCFEYAKYREKYQLSGDKGRIEVCIDETPVGCYVEIEGSAGAIDTVASDLGWTREQFINKNYVDLYSEKSD